MFMHTVGDPSAPTPSPAPRCSQIRHVNFKEVSTSAPPGLVKADGASEAQLEAEIGLDYRVGWDNSGSRFGALAWLNAW